MALLVAFALVPVANAQTAAALEALYKSLPYTNVLPLAAGPVEIGGKVKPIRIGFSQTGFNHPWRVEMINSAKAEVARHSNMSIVVTDGKVDIVKQSGDIDDLIAQGVDAIVMSPVEDAGLRAATRRAMAARIPVIVLDRDVSTAKTMFIGQSNYSLGQRVGEVLVQELTKRYGEPKGNVLEITGLLGSTPATGRRDGFASVISKYPNIKLLARGDGEWIREPAVKLMEDWLIRFDKIDAIYSHAEESSWGAQLAIERAGRGKQGIMHFTCDASNAGFRSVKSGEFMADGNYTPYIGDIGVRAAIYALQGKAMPGKEGYEFGERITLPDLPVVVKANVEQWLGRGWGD
ncbi:MAG: substrate-binding domain-containing protein [Firmicutes bacterium]|nr:substrate-binding domain-containing protein [Bacillota bacterium]